MADEIIVRTWDDMHLYHAGDRVEAEHGVKTRLALGGRDYDLDLTAEHRDELEKLLQPWLDAGQAATKSRGGPSVRAASPAGRPKGRRDSFKAGEPRPATPLAQARRYNREMLEWGERQLSPDGSPRYPITWISAGHGKRKRSFPVALKDDYAAYVADHPELDPRR